MTGWEFQLDARSSSSHIFPGKHPLVCSHVCPHRCLLFPPRLLSAWVGLWHRDSLCVAVLNGPQSNCNFRMFFCSESSMNALRGHGSSQLLHRKNPSLLLLFFPAATWKAPLKPLPLNARTHISTITTWTGWYFVFLHASFQEIRVCPFWKRSVKCDAFMHVLSIPQLHIIAVSGEEREAIVCVFRLSGKWLLCSSGFNKS